jgi:hypothetical protein
MRSSREKNLTRFYSTKLGFGSSLIRNTCFCVIHAFADHKRSEVGGKPTIIVFISSMVVGAGLA